MQTEYFMRRAITLSRQGMSAREGGPFGAVIVKDDQIIGEGWNRVLIARDPTAHAEMEAIRAACATLRHYHLTGCTLFASSEPCPMCLGAIHWAQLDRVYYGCRVQDAETIGFGDLMFYNQLQLPHDERAIPLIQLLPEEALVVFREYAADPNRPIY